jgi:hypothetical protein
MDRPIAIFDELGDVSVPVALSEHLRELFVQSTRWIGHISDVDMIWSLLQNYRDVFVMPGGALGVGQVEAHDVVQTECQKMLELGVIRESKSPWSSPVVLVTKHSPSPQ